MKNLIRSADPPAVDESTRELLRKLGKVFEARDEVLEAYLFGSRAAGLNQPHSDIDIAVYVDESRVADAGFGYAAELTTALMSALHTNEIDVAVLNHADPVLYHRVLRDGARITSRKLKDTTTREGYALSRYCDFVPQLAKLEAGRRAGRMSGR